MEGGFEKASGGKRLISSRIFNNADEGGEKIGIPISLHPAFRYLDREQKGGEREHAASADDKFRKAVAPFTVS